MKITIDTKADSKEEIKKVIGLLSKLVGEREAMASKDIFEQEETLQENVLGNLFENTEKNEEKTKQEEIEPEKEDKGIPDVEFY